MRVYIFTEKIGSNVNIFSYNYNIILLIGFS